MMLYHVPQWRYHSSCQHDKTATLYLSRTKVNFNRPFFKFAINPHPCSYFQWADQEPNESTLALNHPSYLPPSPPPPPSPAAELKKKRFLNPVKQITSIYITRNPNARIRSKKSRRNQRTSKKDIPPLETTTVLQEGNIQDLGTTCTPQELQSIEQLLEATFD